MSHPRTVICIRDRERAHLERALNEKAARHSASIAKLEPPIDAFVFHSQGHLGLVRICSIESLPGQALCHAQQGDNETGEFGKVDSFPLDIEVFTVGLSDAAYDTMGKQCRSPEGIAPATFRFHGKFVYVQAEELTLQLYKWCAPTVSTSIQRLGRRINAFLLNVCFF